MPENFERDVFYFRPHLLFGAASRSQVAEETLLRHQPDSAIDPYLVNVRGRLLYLTRAVEKNRESEI